MIVITYKDDEVWVASKKLAELSGNKNDWTVVMTNYNLGGGRHIKLDFIDKDNTAYRFIANTDNGLCVCLSKDGSFSYLSRKDVIEYRKFFEFIEEPKELIEARTEEPIDGFFKIRYIQ